MHLVQNCRMEVQTEWWVDSSLFLNSIFYVIISYIFGLQIGMITRGEVDIGLAAFYLTEDRAQIVDLSIVFDQAE